MIEGLDEAAEITVLGIGNIVLRDEGFGVRAAEYLRENYFFPDQVRILDGGTLGMELLRFVTGTRRLLILDAIRGDKAPGTVYRLEKEDVAAHFQSKLSAHEVGIQDILTLLALTGKPVPEVVVLGAEPVDLSVGLDLSAELSPLVPDLAARALSELKSWGIEAEPKSKER